MRVAGLKGLVCALAALGAAAAPSARAAAIFVYKGNGSDGRKALPAFERLLGRKVDGVVDFIAFDSWKSFDSDAAWGIWGWKGSGYRLAESVPLTVKGTSLEEVASGAQDAHFARVAKLLVSNGFPDAYVRLGWEFNGGWYPWAFKGHEKAYAAAFRHVVDVMRATPGQRFRFVWCPAQGMQQQWPDNGWPGDDFVDVVGLDVYNQSWRVPVGDKAALWSDVRGSQWGVAHIIKFAAQHGKPYAFPEWGTGDRPDGHGGGDDDVFIANMGPFVQGAEFAGYWDYNAGDYNARVSTGERPRAAAALVKALRAPGGSAEITPASVESLQAGISPSSTPPLQERWVRALSARVSSGEGEVTIQPNADGSAWLTVRFPTGGHHLVSLNQPRPLGWSADRIWFRGTSFAWDSAGTGRVWVGPH